MVLLTFGTLGVLPDGLFLLHDWLLPAPVLLESLGALESLSVLGALSALKGVAIVRNPGMATVQSCIVTTMVYRPGIVAAGIGGVVRIVMSAARKMVEEVPLVIAVVTVAAIDKVIINTVVGIVNRTDVGDSDVATVCHNRATRGTHGCIYSD